MRNQYKILAEKYNLVQEIISPNPSSNTGWLLYPIGQYHDRKIIEKPAEFLQWFKNEYCPSLNIDVDEYESINDIIKKLVDDKAKENNVKIDWEDINYGNDPVFIKIHLMVIEKIYNQYMSYILKIRELLQKGSEEAGVNLDI